MKTRKKTKKKSSASFAFLQHPLPPSSHLTFVRLTISLAILAWLSGAAVSIPIRAQDPRSPHAHDFVIFATVFTNRGFALPGARARVRRSDEKKFRWEALSDRQGEFGIRLPQGAEYELAVEARGFKPEIRKIDAREGNQIDLTIRMEPVPGGKQ
jgi:carboxypeptidase family protein